MMEKSCPAAGKEYSFKATIEIAPAFDLPDYKALSVEVPKGEDADKQIAERLASLKEIYADDVKVETEALAGDMLKVSYESDFQPAEDASPSLKRMAKADEAWIWLHDPEYVPGANAALTGVKAGKPASSPLNSPADWREQGLAGKNSQIHREGQRGSAQAARRRRGQTGGKNSMSKAWRSFMRI